MTAQAQRLVQQALAFPPEERREIAGALLRSMPAQESPQFSAETMAKIEEIRRRYHAGEEPTISGEEWKNWLQAKMALLRAPNPVH
jgi:hypothetical protein